MTMASAPNLFVLLFPQKQIPAAIPLPMCPMDQIATARVMTTVVGAAEAWCLTRPKPLFCICVRASWGRRKPSLTSGRQSGSWLLNSPYVRALEVTITLVIMTIITKVTTITITITIMITIMIAITTPITTPITATTMNIMAAITHHCHCTTGLQVITAMIPIIPTVVTTGRAPHTASTAPSPQNRLEKPYRH